MVETKKTDLTGILNIEYEDGIKSSYKYMEVVTENGNVFFNTGDPLIDWYDYSKFIYNGGATEHGIGKMGYSSSVSHWFIDDNDYLYKYLKYNEDDKIYDFYTDAEIFVTTFGEMKKMIKCTIHKDMKCFQDLIDYYKKNKPLYEKSNV